MNRIDKRPSSKNKLALPTKRFANSLGVLFLYTAFIVFGGAVGLGIGIVVTETLRPGWEHEALPQAPDVIDEILFADTQSTIGDISADMLLVKSQDGTLYTLLRGNWQHIEQIPSPIEELQFSRTVESLIVLTAVGTSYRLVENHWVRSPELDELPTMLPNVQCATDGKDPPPVRQRVLDSNGLILSHAVSKSSRCYVLLEDGSLQVWTKIDSGFESLPILAIGAFLGAIASLWILAARNLVRW